MLPGLDVIAVSGLLTLAAGKGKALQCIVPKPPQINVNPITKQIEYDFSHDSEELSAVQTDTVSPYAPGTDTATGGFRQDTPEIAIQVKVGYRQHPTGPVCFWYDSVDVTIRLQPKIFIASEHTENKKCRSAILEHEKKHVVADREIFNKFAQDIGKTVLEAVNNAGGIGPYNPERIEDVQTMMVQNIEAAVNSKQLAVMQEMRRRQSAIDSYEEYQRVSAICQLEKINKYSKYDFLNPDK